MRRIKEKWKHLESQKYLYEMRKNNGDNKKKDSDKIQELYEKEKEI